MNKLSVKLPELFLERLKIIVPVDRYDDVLTAFCQKRPTTFRINTIKGTTAGVISALTEHGFVTEPFVGIDGGYVLQNKSLRELTETDVYKNGHLYVQSLSSMLPAYVLDPKPDAKILDICAAPGSKTTQIAALMHNSGEIVANDMSKVRLYKLEANLKMQGVTNVRITHGPAETVWQQYPEYFDATLVDVPCSMEGRFYAEDPKTYEDWSPKKVKILAEHQKWILRSAISATKPGGTIVYSTCTLSPEENEGVIDWILKKEKGAVELTQVHLGNDKVVTGPGLQSEASVRGLVSVGEKSFNPEVQKTLRIYPSATMEGFFVAKLRKVRSNIPKVIRNSP